MSDVDRRTFNLATGDESPVTVEVVVNWRELANEIVVCAATSKGRKASRLNGAVRAWVVKEARNG